MEQIGIDFGTTTTQIAYLDGGKLLPDFFLIGANRTAILPSVIAYQRNGRTLFGAEADNATPTEDCLIFRSIKRELVQEGGNHVYDVFDKKITAKEIAQEFLAEAFRRAGRYGASQAIRALICCPTDADRSYREFVRGILQQNDYQADTLKNHVLEEPALAAHVMRQLESFEDDQCVLIYDFGGGTFDAALAQLHRNSETGQRSVDLIYAAGDLDLGGDNIDEAVMEYVLQNIAPGFPAAKLTQAQRFLLLRACRDGKVSLSDEEETTIYLPPTLEKIAHQTQYELSRAELNQIVAPFWQRSLDVLDRLARAYYAVARSSQDRKQSLQTFVDDRVADAVICVGGSSRIPFIRQQLGSIFGAKRVREYDLVPPELAVSAGAALMPEEATATNIRQTAYACSAMLFDSSLELIGQPLVIREAYSHTVSFKSTQVSGRPGVWCNILLSSRVSHVILRFSHADDPMPNRSTKWDDTQGDYVRFCNDSKVGEVAVFIGANGSVELHLKDKEPLKWKSPWADVGKAENALVSEIDAEARRLAEKERMEKEFPSPLWSFGPLDDY